MLKRNSLSKESLNRFGEMVIRNIVNIAGLRMSSMGIFIYANKAQNITNSRRTIRNHLQLVSISLLLYKLNAVLTILLLYLENLYLEI